MCNAYRFRQLVISLFLWGGLVFEEGKIMQEELTMTPSDVARILAEKQRKIRQEWERSVAQASAKKYKPILTRSLPDIFEELTQALSQRAERKDEPAAHLKNEVLDALSAEKQALQAILEYQELKKVLCKHLTTNHPKVDLVVKDIVSNLIDQGVYDVVARFLKEELQETKKSLEKSQANFKNSEENVKRSEHDLKLAKSEILKMSEEKGKRSLFVSTLVHDLKNPLSFIQAASDEILDESDDPQAVTEYAEKIKDKVGQIVNMVHDMLDSELIQSGQKLVLRVQKVNLGALISDIIKESRVVYGDRFHLFIDEKEVIGLWDCNRLKRVIENLLSNAVKHGDPNGVVTITAAKQDSQVIVDVHNNGAPIVFEEQKELFQAYKKLKSSDLKPGWGIGLSFVKEMVEAHGGYVSVQSDAENGTTFRITLPLDQEHAASSNFKS